MLCNPQELAALDRRIERRQRDADFRKAHPEYYSLPETQAAQADLLKRAHDDAQPGRFS